MSANQMPGLKIVVYKINGFKRAIVVVLQVPQSA